MSSFDISPFALPNTEPGEFRFEDPRDIERVVVTFSGSAPDSVTLSYQQKTWPNRRLELLDPATDSQRTGWHAIDDLFNSAWKEAAVNTRKIGDRALEIRFKGLSAEFPDRADYDVAFRRTLGVKVDTQAEIENVAIYTTSEDAVSEILVTLDAGKPTVGGKVALSAYNAVIEEVAAQGGVGVSGTDVTLGDSAPRAFRMKLRHMKPVHGFSYDEGLVTFALDSDTFTISLDSLEKQGPVWFEEEGVYIRFAGDETTFESYQESNRDKKTTAQMVLEYHDEQSYGGAFNGQPRPHAVAGTVGCKHCRQRFWIEPNGDVVLHRNNLDRIKSDDTERFKNEGCGRLFLGLERWSVAGRFLDPGPVLVYNINLKRDDVSLEMKSLAVPLEKSIFDDLEGDDTIACMMRFRFRNTGDQPATAEIPIGYSNNSERSWNRVSSDYRRKVLDGWLVPRVPREKLSVRDLRTSDASGHVLRGVSGEWQGEQVLRCAFAGDVEVEERGNNVVLRRALAPGEECDIVLKIPHIDLDQPREIDALAALDFEQSCVDVTKFWREECRQGAQLKSPEANLDALHRGHLAFLAVTDSAMPGDRELVNTSVGTSTYGNFVNESCMIVEELDERAVHHLARQRINVWLKYQGTEGLMGRFTDHDGVFFGAGGYESGHAYCQHHGWALWTISDHFLLTGDRAWFNSVADQLIKGVDWVARQRRETKTDLPFSRGWEYGWLTAGGLEDVDDYFYWLSTNSLTWRGVEYAARALEAAGHPEAGRVRAEADDYGNCLRRGFDTARQHSPLVRLNDGRWVPQYPSRLYRRGRDVGWIREILEGSVYLLVSGLYDSNSREANWILDDYLDNLYMSPQFGYPVFQPEQNWFDYGGFSQQPCLLAGLLPYLDRDEPEIYIWMFFNAWVSCFREELSGMIEHPSPTLGWSNACLWKTSDQANAVKWLRYMYVCVTGDVLRLGHAIPRDWFSDSSDIHAGKVATRFGQVSIRYKSSAASGKIDAEVEFDERTRPGQMLVRFRHPEKLPIKSVTVNGRNHGVFDAVKGDVDITGMSGRIDVTATY